MARLFGGILFLATLAVLSGCERESLTEIHGATMGTTYSVKVIASAVNSVELKAKIDTELIRINDLMSTYQPDSELSRFNRSVVGEWFDISPDTMDVIRIAREINRLSEGSFDITVGPLVNLWGFGPDPASSELPSNEAIAAATARVGFGHLRLGDGKLMKDVDTYVDLSAIAKGYGVDRVTALLDAGGFKNYLVEIGGELGARGLNERGGPWRIAIERPDVAERVPFVTITFSDRGMATSGDYRNYFEKDGIRYSHTIDPATGRPVTHTLASVTVIAPTAALADGLATAIDVMGPEKGLAMAEAHHIAAFAIIKSEGGFVERHTSAFASYF